MFEEISPEAKEVLHLLKEQHNVIISGAPGTGKSRLLAEVAHWFCKASAPGFDPSGEIAFPDAALDDVAQWLPSHERAERRVFPTCFHQGTKHRDFVSGIVPAVGGGNERFLRSEGILVRANNFARQAESASLVLIDEINRGPAVAVFGDTLTAIESDKRLDKEDQTTPTSVPFSVLSDSGIAEDTHLSSHCYILAAMNEADTSVEPLDVAFLRRFAKYRLSPDFAKAQQFLELENAGRALPDKAEEIDDMFQAILRAWKAINNRVALGRGPEFQLGHGALMGAAKPGTLAEAKSWAVGCWNRILAHVEEVFFGDDAGMAAALNAHLPESPYRVEERFFGDRLIRRIRTDIPIETEEVFNLLRAVGAEDDESQRE